MQRILYLLLLPCSLIASAAEPAMNQRGMVATVHPLATDAGVAALERGGNAIDAAVAAALTLGVVDGHNSGLGGGCFVLIRSAEGSFAAIDGRETAPASASRDMYVRNGKADNELSTTGALASATPGALAAYETALRKHGRLTLADLLRPAADLADRGFHVDRVYARNLKTTARDLAKFDGSRSVLFKADGSPLVEGELLRQSDLAKTYREIAEHGIDWFYRGPFAATVAAWMITHGGRLTLEDFANYRPVLRDPLVTTYRGHTLVGFPPPSSGGVHVAQIMNILETFALKTAHGAAEDQFTHLGAEAMKMAFADRAYWLGDPDFARVPRGLVDREYAARLAKQVDPRRAMRVGGHGAPPNAHDKWFGKHTTHIAAADAEGNWVGITATVNTSFGSKVIVPGTGVILNNEMDDFSIQPGVPNAFGLIGAEANAIAPGKRPLSSMSPTIVLRDGRPILTIGAAGGPTIISQVVLGIVRHLDLGQPLHEALAAPRFHHQWSPDELVVEQSISETVREQLKARGHTIRVRESIGVTQAIGLASDGKTFIGVHDPRVPGKAAGPVNQ